MANFTYFSRLPPGLRNAGAVIAATRAGWIGIVNAELEGKTDALSEEVECVARCVRSPFGIALDSLDDELSQWLRQLAQRSTLRYVFLPAEVAAANSTILIELRDANLQIVGEVIGTELPVGADIDHVDAWIVKGHEAGGFVGEASAFVLLQKWKKLSNRPLYVHGGMTPRATAACRVAGARGVLFESQTLLLEEVGLPEGHQAIIQRLSGSETVTVGDGEAGEYLRLLVQPTWRVAKQLVEDGKERSKRGLRELLQRHREANPLVTTDPRTSLLLLGQDVCFAATFKERYGSFRQLLSSIETCWADTVKSGTSKALGSASPLAKELGTRLPIVQGPMTRVSDRPEFAAAIAESGALPMVACALLRGEALASVLKRTAEMLGDKPWGIGLLGFAPGPLLSEQLSLALRYRPAFAIIAGGRPDQAVELEASHIASFLHVPSKNLIPLFLEEGARRFIFEGRECGGHIGPLSSFVLWEAMVDELCSQITARPEIAGEISVLFAGGIHDAESSAIVQVLAAPLIALHVRVGLLMGSAYLFTEEIVSTGAILPTFQQEVLSCERTVSLESGPGHASRCGYTPFAREFFAKRRALQNGAVPAEQARNTLDDLILGRLRIASKGVARDSRGLLIDYDPDRQKAEGMYMLGQVATLRDTTTTVSQLHEEVTTGAAGVLESACADASTKTLTEAARPCDIAVVGMATLLPGSSSTSEYWENILDKVDAIVEIPSHRWDFRLYFDEDRSAPDKIYSKWGGFLSDVPFDPARYGIPPRSVRSVDPMQLMALEVAARALADAGYDRRPFDRQRASVIVGASGGTGDVGTQYGLRAELPRFAGRLPPQIAEQLPEWTEDSFAGILNNVVAGRIANRLDLGGANFTTDAACASSLASLYQGVNELVAGRSDLVIAGGIDTVQGPFGYLCFSKTQALSPRGKCSSFDASADGIVISEGVAMVICKRLADAERDGDRIYAVIKGMGASSDGRARGMTAPLPEGQLRAMRRAYAQAGYDASSVGMFEAHGTGTVAGDTAELESTTRLLLESQANEGQHPPPTTTLGAGRAVVGSVKTMIGHTKATAGMAGFVKSALALHHRVLPPHKNVEEPNKVLTQPNCPLVLLRQPLPWLTWGDTPRRASVSAFGFGGTNFHVTLEEYQDEYRPRMRAPGRGRWSSELCVWSTHERSTLLAAARRDLEIVRGRYRREQWSLSEIAATLWEAYEGGAFRLAIVARDALHLDECLSGATAFFEGRSDRLPDCVFTNAGDSKTAGVHGAEQPKVAFLFSGQGCQYPGMARDLALGFDLCRDTLAEADSILKDEFESRHSRSLSSFIWPEPWYVRDSARQVDELKSTDVAQPALGAVDTALFRVVTALGLRADMMAGHSFGEFVALHAASAIDFRTLLKIAEARGRFIVDAATTSGAELGTMAAVHASRETIEKVLANVPELVLANHNAPLQSIISGSQAAIAKGIRLLEVQGIAVTAIPVAAAFHSPLVQAARDSLAQVIEHEIFSLPEVPVYSNTHGAAHPNDVAKIKRTMTEHLMSPVEFVRQIETMYEEGARIFVELGPKAVLTGLTRKILSNRAHLALATDSKEGLDGLHETLGQLLCAGVPLNLGPLFTGRVPEKSARGRGQEPDLSRTWLLNGSRARPYADPEKRVGLSWEETQHGTPTPVREDPLSAPVTSQPHPKLAPPVTTTSFKERTMDDDEDAPATQGEATALAYFETMQQFLRTQERVMAMLTRGQASGVEQPAVTNGTSSQGAARPARYRDAVPMALPAALRAGQPKPGESLAAANGAPRKKAESSHRASQPIDQGDHVKPTPVAPSKSQDAGTPAETTWNDAKLSDALLDVVESKTGYPKDIVGVDQNLEGELGIDSIKRVEIVGALLQMLPEAWRTALGSRRTELNTQATLQGILDILKETRPHPSEDKAHKNGSAEGTRPFEGTGAGEVTQAWSLPRYVLVSQKESIPPDRLAPLERGHYVLTEDQLGVADALASRLTAAGCSITRLKLDEFDNEERFVTRVRELVSEATIDGVIHLASVGSPAVSPQANQSTWQRELFVNEQSLFLMLRESDSRLQKGALVLCATSLGGNFGREALEARKRGETDLPGLHLCGGAVGLLKSYSEERPGIFVKAIDLDPEQPIDRLTDQLESELRARTGRQEVGYPKGHRTIFRTTQKDLPLGSSPPLLHQDLVILATGGARGITAEVLRELAGSGRKLVLVGRRPFLPEDPSTAHLLCEKALRDHFIAQARAANLPLSSVGKRVQQVLASREVAANLEDFRSRGAQVEYHVLDVTDENALAALIAEVQSRLGNIDGVVHGAGVIEDKRLVDKSSESFQRVVSGKVMGFLCLQKHLPLEKMKFLVVFSSVAGRYGNSGQSDYALANELLNRLCCDVSRAYPDLNVVSLCWGPWGPTLFGAGMVTPQTAAKFAEKGVQLVTAEEGRRLFLEETLRTPGQEIEVVMGQGPWEAREAEKGAWGQESPAEEANQRRLDAPLLTDARIELQKKGEQLITFCIDRRHEYLRDHVIDGTAVLPAAAVVEMMVEGAALCWPGWRILELQECRLLKGIEFDGSTQEFELELSPAAYASSEGFDVTAILRKAAQNGRARLHYKATIRFGQTWDRPSGGLPPFSTAAPGLDVESAYENLLFHGPRFRTITQIESLSDEGGVARVVPSRPNDWLLDGAMDEAWKIDPALLDAAPQLAIVWARKHLGTTCLPVGFGRIALSGPGLRHSNTEKVVYLARPQTDPTRVVADVYFLDAQDQVTLMVEGLECVASENLNRLAGEGARRPPLRWSPGA